MDDPSLRGPDAVGRPPTAMGWEQSFMNVLNCAGYDWSDSCKGAQSRGKGKGHGCIGGNRTIKRRPRSANADRGCSEF